MKNAIITGASSGIGKQIAKTFYDKGWTPHLVARNEQRLEALSTELGNCPFHVCDLSSPDQITKLVKKCDGLIVDALVNNAGAYQPAAFEEAKDEQWQQAMDINFFSAVRLTQGLWGHLKSSCGHVLNISSTLAIRPIANTAAYSASKAAMNNWTLSLAIEGAPHQVRANAICPGIVDTPIHSFHGGISEKDKAIQAQVQKAQPLGRIGQPQDIAALAYLLCSDQSSWTTGSVINVDGGILLNS